ncbi:alpha-farnesene synthase-like [Durio zibethinus]|uniref:Alpha-farnesene synthase-like n=1 Tax=Durio zibethinus TaxID=66656 RepID=A0A6P5WXL6_DURZI|nr:alpha-farnesene synthase-like [Durio zibethinus]
MYYLWSLGSHESYSPPLMAGVMSKIMDVYDCPSGKNTLLKWTNFARKVKIVTQLGQDNTLGGHPLKNEPITQLDHVGNLSHHRKKVDFDLFLLYVLRWWRNLGLVEHLNFTRDRLAESFLCAVGLTYEPQYSCFRKCLTKITTMTLIIDDVYDVYGSIEELEQFTDAVDRWDSSKIQQLPGCMKICFQALYDIINEIAHDIHELNGWDVEVLLNLRKAWAGFYRALFVEAKWYSEGYTPSLQEYLSNALISSGGIVISVHSILSLGHDVANEMVHFLGKNQDLVYNISVITRLCNDLGTSVAEKERGDAPSSILCYMREVNSSEEKAREHIKEMIIDTWKKINGQCFSNQSPLLQTFVKVTTNVARMVHCLYQFGDGFGIQDQETRRHILSLLIEPFKLD